MNPISKIYELARVISFITNNPPPPEKQKSLEKELSDISVEIIGDHLILSGRMNKFGSMDYSLCSCVISCHNASNFGIDWTFDWSATGPELLDRARLRMLQNEHGGQAQIALFAVHESVASRAMINYRPELRMVKIGSIPKILSNDWGYISPAD